jgi:hypothetical protein
VAGARLRALTLTTQFLQTRMDYREIVGSSRTSSLTTELFDASADYREIIGRTQSGHISSPLHEHGLLSPSDW